MRWAFVLVVACVAGPVYAANTVDLDAKMELCRHQERPDGERGSVYKPGFEDCAQIEREWRAQRGETFPTDEEQKAAIRNYMLWRAR